MTEEQKKEVVRVVGPDWQNHDIPAIWRNQEDLNQSEPDDLGDIEKEK